MKLAELKAAVSSLLRRVSQACKKAVADPYDDSWWQKRVPGRRTCLDLKDIKKCGSVLSQKAKNISISNESRGGKLG